MKVSNYLYPGWCNLLISNDWATLQKQPLFITGYRLAQCTQLYISITRQCAKTPHAQCGILEPYTPTLWVGPTLRH